MVAKKISQTAVSELSDKKIQDTILELAKQGMTTEKIGLVLKDKYHVNPKRVLGKKIGQIIKEKNLYKDPDINNLNLSLEKLKKHHEKHKHDHKVKIAILIKGAKLNKLMRYMKKKGQDGANS